MSQRRGSNKAPTGEEKSKITAHMRPQLGNEQATREQQDVDGREEAEGNLSLTRRAFYSLKGFVPV